MTIFSKPLTGIREPHNTVIHIPHTGESEGRRDVGGGMAEFICQVLSIPETGRLYELTSLGIKVVVRWPSFSFYKESEKKSIILNPGAFLW